MKTIFCLSIGLLALCNTRGQETVYFSNLGQSATSTSPVASDSWLFEGFGTGPNPGGYVLDSVQLAMADATGNPNGFTVMIYSRVFNGPGFVPGSSLGTLQGPFSPVTAGVYDYTPSGNLILSPNTGYYIVLTSATPSSDGTYNWNRTAYRPSSIDSWGVDQAFHSSDGNWTGWHSFSDEGYGQFSITAEPAPEPSSSWLLFLGSGILFYVRRHRKYHCRPIP